MRSRLKLTLPLLCFALGASPFANAETAARQDAKAMEVLQSMGAYTRSLDKVHIKGVSMTDARLAGGLMVTNTDEIEVRIARPGSLHISSFNGEAIKHLYFHDGKLSVFNSETKYYARAEIPDELDAALEFALETLDIEAPIMDMIYQDASVSMIGPEITVLYLTDKARVAGVDCHHIVIRGPEVDAQLWIEEGERPLPRKMMLTDKWEGGSPRHVANMAWYSGENLEAKDFQFEAPEGSINIGFAPDVRAGE